MRASAMAAFALAVAGCAQAPRGSDDPTPTDGPNQVVLKVPGMT